ncbi:hypothetical protein HH1059_09590 [Halorhodospira halochloris]|uniref:Uncharacterized protein n=1 Tax=Halorhodospira halochloris TaxID=1052 RepID=A0A2Z6EZE6_HALHR|nr:hypothetical protein HH1059_09590 [Halorhodospira halochloris]
MFYLPLIKPGEQIALLNNIPDTHLNTAYLCTDFRRNLVRGERLQATIEASNIAHISPLDSTYFNGNASAIAVPLTISGAAFNQKNSRGASRYTGAEQPHPAPGNRP